MENKNYVLVTGGTGFIGAHQCNEFVNNGYNVVAFSRSGNSINKEFNENVKKGLITVISGDVQNFDFDSLNYQFDYIIHIAGKVSVYGELKDFMKINYDGTKRLLEYAKKHNVKCFTYFSSTAVYGYYGFKNITEDADKKPFKNPYSISKLKTENLVKDYCKENSMDYVIIRPGNVYGEYDYTSSHEIFTRIKKGKMLICAKGKYESCFVYVKNLTNAVFIATTLDTAHNTDYNVTDGNRETLNQIFTLIANTFNVKPKFKNFPAFMSKIIATIVEGTYYTLHIKKAPLITKFSVYQNCNDYSFSIDKIKGVGYNPLYSMAQGIKNTCDWINSLT